MSVAAETERRGGATIVCLSYFCCTVGLPGTSPIRRSRQISPSRHFVVRISLLSCSELIKATSSTGSNNSPTHHPQQQHHRRYHYFVMPNNNNNSGDDDDGATILDDGLSICDDEQDHETNRRHHHHHRILTTSADAARQAAEVKRYRRFTCALFVITFLISAIASSVKIYHLPRDVDYNNNYWNDIIFGTNKLQEKENALRLNQTLEYLIRSNSVVNSKVTLLEEANNDDDDYYVSAQYAAAVWIAQYDKFRIPIPTPPAASSSTTPATASNQTNSIFSSNSRKSSEEYQFLQRYSLAVLFFSTGGIDMWKYKLNFLRGVHECEGWVDIFMINEEGSSEIFPFGVICDEEPDYETTEIMEEDVWKGTRTVTAIVLPRKFLVLSQVSMIQRCIGRENVMHLPIYTLMVSLSLMATYISHE